MQISREHKLMKTLHSWVNPNKVKRFKLCLCFLISSHDVFAPTAWTLWRGPHYLHGSQGQESVTPLKTSSTDTQCDNTHGLSTDYSSHLFVSLSNPQYFHIWQRIHHCAVEEENLWNCTSGCLLIWNKQLNTNIKRSNTERTWANLSALFFLHKWFRKDTTTAIPKALVKTQDSCPIVLNIKQLHNRKGVWQW